MGISTANLGMSYSISKMYDSAIYYLGKSIELREKENDKLGLVYSYMAIAQDYQQLKQYKKALAYGEAALAIAREINSKERISTTAKALAAIYKDIGDYKKAYEAILTYSDYLTEIFDTIKSEQAEELAVKYEVEKKDLLIQKDKAELKNKQAQIENQGLKLSQRNTQLSLLGILLLATGVTSWQFYNRNRLKHEARLQQEIIRQQDLASKAIIEAEERERKRIAGDLHDGLGQLCSAIKLNLSTLGSQIQFNDKDSAISYEKTLVMTDQACRDVRSISHQMMPNVLLKAGLASAVRDFLDKIDARVLQVHLDVFGLQERLENNTEAVLYRVIQEAVNNVIKHSGANSLYIQLSKEEEGISATIEDNGTGFDVNEMEKFNGIGLKNITSRISFLKGTVEFDSAPGRGTVVSIWVPA
jgi:signal transduction histidine kinase